MGAIIIGKKNLMVDHREADYLSIVYPVTNSINQMDRLREIHQTN